MFVQSFSVTRVARYGGVFMSGELLSNVNTPFGVIEGFCLGRACRRMRTAFLCVDVSGCLCKNTEKSGKQFAGKEKGVKKKKQRLNAQHHYCHQDAHSLAASTLDSNPLWFWWDKVCLLSGPRTVRTLELIGVRSGNVKGSG